MSETGQRPPPARTPWPRWVRPVMIVFAVLLLVRFGRLLLAAGGAVLVGAGEVLMAFRSGPILAVLFALAFAGTLLFVIRGATRRRRGPRPQPRPWPRP